MRKTRASGLRKKIGKHLPGWQAKAMTLKVVDRKSEKLGNKQSLKDGQKKDANRSLEKGLLYISEVNYTKQICIKPTKTSKTIENSQYFPCIAVEASHYKERADGQNNIPAKV